MQFTNPEWLWLLPPTVLWVCWLTWRSDASIGPVRRWVVGVLRLVITVSLALALAGLQSLETRDGLNVMFLLDRSRSVSQNQQESARLWVNEIVKQKRPEDRAGLLVFGGDAGIEQLTRERLELGKIQTVVNIENTDISAAVRLGTAAFPEHGQKRLVLLSDGNETLGDAVSAVAGAQSLEVSVDAVPFEMQRINDVFLQRLALPNHVKEGTAFETKIFVESDQAAAATLQLTRNGQLLGTQEVELQAGKNLLVFPQQLPVSGFYAYEVTVAAENDRVAQNNRAINFVTVRGDPRVLIVSDNPELDRNLAAALETSQLRVELTGLAGFPQSLAQMQSYDAIFLSNISAGDLSNESMRQLESAVRDFGVGLVCIGGDQAFAAGAYRGTPLERVLPLDMELSSKKVMPSGALAMLMHGMEFNNGNQIARHIAAGVLDAMGPQDYIGIVLWDGKERWLFPMTQIRTKRGELRNAIIGMNQGDLPSFNNIMNLAYQGLKATPANLRHLIVFSDGDPAPPSAQLMNDIVASRITVSTVLIAGHGGPETMQWMAEQGNGRFYDVRSPDQLPQVFIKETAVVLKSAISEQPFVPRRVASSELLRGLENVTFPRLLGHVATVPKARADLPLMTEGEDPLLAHWQFGLGRSVAFTSDARGKWAAEWLAWPHYRQFWSQIAQWALRRLDNTDFSTETIIEGGVGLIAVEAVDEQGEFRNFLELDARVVSPEGESRTVKLRQMAPGRYEAKFAALEVGAYTVNLMQLENGEIVGTQMTGASVNYSPEFASSETDYGLLRQLTEISAGKLHAALDGAADPFAHGRRQTYQPHDLWEWLLKLAIVLFVLDVALRRVQLDREDLKWGWKWFVRRISFRRPVAAESDASLVSLLKSRDAVRARQSRKVSELKELDTLQTVPARPKAPAGTAKSAVKLAGPATERRPKPPEPTEQTTAGRLLAAKRKVQRKRPPQRES